MKTIAIEINHVIRNLNHQIVKYYKKAFDDTIDLDEYDDEVDPLASGICQFASIKQRNNFLYIDYPFEIFGCAKEVEKNIQTFVNTFIYDMDEDVNVIYYSLYDDALSIQSTYYFLSKIGCRVKNVLFIKDPSEIWKHTDAIVTANGDYLTKEAPDGKKVFRISRKFNLALDNTKSVVKTYGNLSTLLQDRENLLEILNKES